MTLSFGWIPLSMGYLISFFLHALWHASFFPFFLMLFSMGLFMLFGMDFFLRLF
jgi:hypothetical protein